MASLWTTVLHLAKKSLRTCIIQVKWKDIFNFFYFLTSVEDHYIISTKCIIGSVIKVNSTQCMTFLYIIQKIKSKSGQFFSTLHNRVKKSNLVKLNVYFLKWKVSLKLWYSPCFRYEMLSYFLKLTMKKVANSSSPASPQFVLNTHSQRVKHGGMSSGNPRVHCARSPLYGLLTHRAIRASAFNK